jgi:hypothetical protein
MLSAKDIDPSTLEYALEKHIGRAVSRAKKQLKDLGFECTLMAGPTSDMKDTWEEWTTDGDNPGSIVAKLYFTLNKNGNKYTDGVLTDVYVDKFEGWDRIGGAADVEKVTCSTKTSVMAGAGSGITLELADLDFTEVPDGGFYNEYNDMHDFLEPENGWCNGTIQIKSIGTYYDGGDPGLGDIQVSIQVAEVIPDDADDAQALIGDSLKSVVDDIYEIEDKVLIGGGYTRSTFTGEFETEAFTSDATLKLKVKIEDNGIAEWLDKFAHGESEEIYFDICINGDPQGDYFESQEDAIATAQEYAADPQYADDEITVMMEHYSTNYEGEIMDYFDDAGDIVWSSNDALYE